MIFAERFSLRLPSRMSASCVSEPMGTERPVRAASTPAMNVVATAPMPGISTASFPEAGAIFVCFFVSLMLGSPAGLVLRPACL